ncbi:MAG TPA: DUF3566 domain-containing protein [Streptosporangiaceae bacterium]|nr:DUF3566 domain-containing protein [Streptosporangiaceae bacterium]
MVTSRATGDDLIEDQDTQSADITDDTTTSGIMAPPSRPARKPAPAKPASGDDASGGKAGGDVPVNGTPAAEEAARPAPVDATIVDGIPALPADTIGSSRGKPKEPAGSTGPTRAEPATGNSGTSDSSVFSFGPPPSAPAKPAVEDPLIAYPAEAAVKPAGEVSAPVPAAGTTSGPGSPATASSEPRSSDSGSSAPAPDGWRPEKVSPEASSVPPAAFAWEMPDPPPHSPSSPARAFLRSGVTAKNPAPARPSSSASSPATAPAAPAGKPATGEARPRGPVTLGQSRPGPSKGGPGAGTGAAKGQQKAQSKAQSKRSARQAHLTISRIEPWSVMKFSFVVSLVAFVILFVAVSVLYGALSGLGVFDSIQKAVNSVTSSQGSAGVNAKAWFSASRVLGYTALLGSLNIVLITAMSTIGSVVYNLTSRLVGGVEVTLRETE